MKYTLPNIAGIWLCSQVPNGNAETEFWGKGEENSFIALPGNGGPQQASAPKTAPHPDP